MTNRVDEIEQNRKVLRDATKGLKLLPAQQEYLEQAAHRSESVQALVGLIVQARLVGPGEEK